MFVSKCGSAHGNTEACSFSVLYCQMVVDDGLGRSHNQFVLRRCGAAAGATSALHSLQKSLSLVQLVFTKMQNVITHA